MRFDTGTEATLETDKPATHLLHGRRMLPATVAKTSKRYVQDGVPPPQEVDESRLDAGLFPNLHENGFREAPHGAASACVAPRVFPRTDASGRETFHNFVLFQARGSDGLPDSNSLLVDTCSLCAFIEAHQSPVLLFVVALS